MEKLKYLFDYFYYLKNPLSALAFKFSLKKSCVVKPKKSDLKLKLTSINTLNLFMMDLPAIKADKLCDFVKYIKSIDNDEKFVLIDDINYYNVYNTHFKKEHPYHYGIHITEHFTDDDWNMINFKNRHVIDVGANVADSALYFAKNGANVLAFEPVKHLYELGIDNISVNPNLKENITLINKAVGGGEWNNIY